MLKRIMTEVFHIMPFTSMKIISPICGIFVDNKLLETRLMEKYANYLEIHFEDECRKILKNKKIMVIDDTNLKFSTFNMTYVNIALSHMLYAMYHGCIPVIKGKKNGLCWEWYFKQPYLIVPEWGG